MILFWADYSLYFQEMNIVEQIFVEFLFVLSIFQISSTVASVVPCKRMQWEFSISYYN